MKTGALHVTGDIAGYELIVPDGFPEYLRWRRLNPDILSDETIGTLMHLWGHDLTRWIKADWTYRTTFRIKDDDPLPEDVYRRLEAYGYFWQMGDWRSVEEDNSVFVETIGYPGYRQVSYHRR